MSEQYESATAVNELADMSDVDVADYYYGLHEDREEIEQDEMDEFGREVMSRLLVKADRQQYAGQTFPGSMTDVDGSPLVVEDYLSRMAGGHYGATEQIINFVKMDAEDPRYAESASRIQGVLDTYLAANT